jgi:hypothetical protein
MRQSSDQFKTLKDLKLQWFAKHEYGLWRGK